MLDRTKQVSCGLDWQPEDAIHIIFHVSQLKPYCGSQFDLFPTLIVTYTDIKLETMMILNRKMVKQDHRVDTMVLIH